MLFNLLGQKWSSYTTVQRLKESKAVDSAKGNKKH